MSLRLGCVPVAGQAALGASASGAAHSPGHGDSDSGSATALQLRVLFVQRRLPAYRVPFVHLARAQLALAGIDLEFAYGQPSSAEALKQDEGELPWARRLPTHYLGRRLCWQPFTTAGFDLVVVTQENSLLFNHWLCRPWRAFRLGFFGHGGNLAASNPDSPAERFKRFTTRRADWWFAYTSHSRDLVARTGFSPERISVLNNAVDTDALRAQVAGVSAAALQDLQQQVGLRTGKTALFLGSLYAGKGLELLLAAAQRCAANDAAFRLLIVGDGEAAGVVRLAARTSPWLHWAGAQHGAAKARYLAAADMLLIPGSVGLAILDGFAVGLPILSTSARGHGPEFVYLQPGYNGEVTEPEVGAYAAAIQQLLDDPVRLARLRAGATESGRHYSVQSMASAFAHGVQAALGAPLGRSARWRPSGFQP